MKLSLMHYLYIQISSIDLFWDFFEYIFSKNDSNRMIIDHYQYRARHDFAANHDIQCIVKGAQKIHLSNSDNSQNFNFVYGTVDEYFRFVIINFYQNLFFLMISRSIVMFSTVKYSLFLTSSLEQRSLLRMDKNGNYWKIDKKI